MVRRGYLCIAKFGSVLLKLLEPNFFHIVKAGSVDNTDGDQENVCSVIGQHSYPVEILLSSGIPKTALMVFKISGNFHTKRK